MTLGERMRQRRFQCGAAAGREHGYSQEEIAEIAGVRQPQYSRWEADRQLPPLLRMGSIAAKYGMTIEEAFPEYRPGRADRELVRGTIALLATGQGSF